MKKRILFVLTNLNTGGILRSLQNFLNLYDSNLYAVDVFAMTHEGIFKKELKNCAVLPPNRILNASLAHYNYQHGLKKLESLILKLTNKVTGYRFQNVVFRLVARGLVKSKQYNAVIAFSEGVPTSFVSLMAHPNKIGWIHCDYASYYKLNNKRSEKRLYQALKSIVCVSEYTRATFLQYFPEMEDHTYSIYNTMDVALMKSKSMQMLAVPFDLNTFNIVSVGRIDPVKRLSVIPEVARNVVDKGCIIKWYVVGPKGTEDEFDLLLHNIAKFNVKDEVILLGETSNPYPYILNADLLVNTSISEACPYVINEAKILHTPVVCTDFGSAKEFIENGVNGYYVPLDQMANTIVSLINDKKKLLDLKNNLVDFQYDNDAILRQIYDLL